jgi:hypothetical protein
MKNIIQVLLLTLVCILNWSSLMALRQSDDFVRKYFVAVNVSKPLFQAIAPNHQDTAAENISPSLLYVGRQGKKNIYRFGITGTSISSESKSQLTFDKTTTSVQKLRAYLSFYRSKYISNRWQVQYGLNATGVMYWNDQVYDTGFDRVNIYTRKTGGGIGPGILFHYKINERLMLSSEYMLLFQYLYGSVGKRFTAIPNENYTNEKTKTMSLQFNYPISLYLHYHF